MSTKKIGINPVTVLGGYTGNLTLPSSKQPGNVGVKNLPVPSAPQSPALGSQFGNAGLGLPTLGSGNSNGTLGGGNGTANSIPSVSAWAGKGSQKSTGNAGNALLEEGESSLLPKGKKNSDFMKEVQASGNLSMNNGQSTNQQVNNSSTNVPQTQGSKDSGNPDDQSTDTGKELPPAQDPSGGTASDKESSSDGTITEETPKADEDTGTAGAQPMGYEEYLEELRKGYEAQLEAARKQAEETRQRAVIDAQSSYMQNLAGYGANAEHLAAAGMQGGGYSDYLNAQAYAQKRADIQQANAQAAYENRSAEGQYQDYINSLNEQLAQKALEDERLREERLYNQQLLKEQRDYEESVRADQYAHDDQVRKEQRDYEESVRAAEAQRQQEESQTQKRDNLYANLWEQVIDPSTTLTPEALDAFAREYGLSDQQTASLKSLLSATQTASQAKTTKERSESLLASALSDIETNGAYLSDDYLESLRKMGLSDEDYEKAKEVFQSSRYRSYRELLREANEMGSSFDTNAVDETYKNGMLTEQQYNNLKAAWNDSLDLTSENAISIFLIDGEPIPKDVATKKLNEIIGEESWLEDDRLKETVRLAYLVIYDQAAYWKEVNEKAEKAKPKTQGGNGGGGRGI